MSKISNIYILILVLCFGGDLSADSSKPSSDRRSQTGPHKILFVLDASGSMALNFGGASRMEAARLILHENLSRINEKSQVGLVAYGNGIRGCKSARLYVPIGSSNRSYISRVVNTMDASGNTPLAETLRLVRLRILPEHPGTTVIVISDGAESCGGDPLKEAALLKARGGKVHVLGISVNALTAIQLRGVARAGNGRYFNVRNYRDFRRAFKNIPMDNRPRGVDPVRRPGTTVKPGPAPIIRKTPEVKITGDRPLVITGVERLEEKNGKVRLAVEYKIRPGQSGDYQVSFMAMNGRIKEGPDRRLKPGKGLISTTGAAHYDTLSGSGRVILEIASGNFNGRPIYIQGELWNISEIPKIIYVSNSATPPR